MHVKKFCWCCYKESDFYQNPTTLKVDRYCLDCASSFTPDQRKTRELKFILGAIEITEEQKESNIE